MKIKILLNGTDTNPWHKYGLRQNPFPIIAKAEFMDCLLLGKLGADPIQSVEYIRETLKGFSNELVDLCCEQFKKGEMVSFYVEWPD